MDEINRFLSREIPDPFTVITLVTSLCVLGFVMWKANREYRKITAQDRMKLLTRSLATASETLEALDREVRKRHALAEKLRDDFLRAKLLEELSPEQEEAVTQSIALSMQEERRRSRPEVWATNGFFTVLGTLLGAFFF